MVRQVGGWYILFAIYRHVPLSKKMSLQIQLQDREVHVHVY